MHGFSNGERSENENKMGPLMFARHARAQAALKIFEGIWSKETVFVYVFSVLMVFCNSFPSVAGQDAGMEIYSTDKRRSLFFPPTAHKTEQAASVSTKNQNIRTEEIVATITQVNSPLLSVPTHPCATRCACCPHRRAKLHLHSIISKTICPVLRLFTSGFQLLLT